MASSALRLLLLASALAGCQYGQSAPDGTFCTKNEECQSNHCVSDACRPKPLFAASSPAPSTTSAPDAGAADATGE